MNEYRNHSNLRNCVMTCTLLYSRLWQWIFDCDVLSRTCANCSVTLKSHWRSTRTQSQRTANVLRNLTVVMLMKRITVSTHFVMSFVKFIILCGLILAPIHLILLNFKHIEIIFGIVVVWRSIILNIYSMIKRKWDPLIY